MTTQERRDLIRLLADAAGVGDKWNGLVWVSTFAPHKTGLFRNIIWDPLANANQMDIVEASTTDKGIYVSMSYQTHSGQWEVKIGFDYYGEDPDRKTAFALAIKDRAEKRERSLKDDR